MINHTIIHNPSCGRPVSHLFYILTTTEKTTIENRIKKKKKQKTEFVLPQYTGPFIGIVLNSMYI